MNTPTPTGDPIADLPGWMPDEATLTRMANDFFGPLTVSEPAAETTTPAAAVTTSLAPAAPAGQPLTEFPVNHGAAQPPRPGAYPLELQGLQTQAPYVLQLPGSSAAQAPARPRGVVPVQAGLGYPSFPGVQVPVIPGIAPPVRPAAEVLGHEPVNGLPSTTDAGGPSFYFVRELPSAAETLPAALPGAGPVLDVETIRQDFPILRERVHGRQLVWLDNAATTQKPQAVIDRLAEFYAHENSNVHRGAHTLATRATDAYEGARTKLADFLGASSRDDVVFTRGTTEAINLVAQSWGRQHIGRGDEIVISHLEHHANIVPWQHLAQQTGAKLKVIPVGDDGQVLLDAYAGLLSDRTRLVSIAQVSNVLGTVVPVQEIIDAAHRAGAVALVDGAQAVAHMPVNVQAMDADFYVFSGHKVFAPTGIGALYGKPEVLEDTPPWQGGGNMIANVTFEQTRYQGPPGRFEAGTGSIADAVGLGAALDYVSALGLPIIRQYEHELLEYATSQLRTVPGLRLIGTAPHKASVLTFVLEGYRPEDVASALDQQGIAVRAGHHCAQPILRRYGLESAVRPSLAMYNTCDEVDLLVSALCTLAADAGLRR